MLRVDGSFIDDSELIEQHVLDFYRSLYAEENTCEDNGLIERVIPSLVTNIENAMLTNLPSKEEVKADVFSMKTSSAPVPNGFGACFYQAHWDIVQHDVFDAVSQFFTQSWLTPNFNSNLVSLIPKFKGANKITDYRPIALTNFKFMIISKVLADRLEIVAPRICSILQKGFIKGRSILDCICTASEAINR